MAKQKQERECLSNINVALRKVKGQNVTAQQILKEEFVDSLVQHDAGFRILKNIRTSPAYWERIKGELLTMIRQLGRPAIFLTLSPGETQWPELLQNLYKHHYGKDITNEEAMNLDPNIKTKMIRKDIQ